MKLQGIRFESVELIHEAQDRLQWWHLVKTIVNLQVP